MPSYVPHPQWGVHDVLAKRILCVCVGAVRNESCVVVRCCQRDYCQSYSIDDEHDQSGSASMQDHLHPQSLMSQQPMMRLAWVGRHHGLRQQDGSSIVGRMVDGDGKVGGSVFWSDWHSLRPYQMMHVAWLRQIQPIQADAYRICLPHQPMERLDSNSLVEAE